MDVSGNGDLEFLGCNYTSIETLDFSQNPNLDYVYVQNNSSLVSINISQNLELKTLRLYNNSLPSLNVSNNIKLELLDVKKNNLTSIDVSHNINLHSLILIQNPLNNLDITNNVNLKWLTAGFSQPFDLDLSQNLNLDNLQLNNLMSNLDLSHLTELNRVYLNQCHFTTINIKNGNNANLAALWTKGNPNLECIKVDDENATRPTCSPGDGFGWCKDVDVIYSENCLLSAEDFTTTDFQLFPNPTENLLSIQSKENIESVKIYSIQGILVKEVSSKIIDVSQLSAGMYFAKINFNGKSFTKKFIKE